MESSSPTDPSADAPKEPAAADTRAHYVDHEPGAWFLIEKQGRFYLDVRFSMSVVDDAALIELTDAEARRCRDGHDLTDALARKIAANPPPWETSPFHGRDLYRTPSGGTWRDEVRGAIYEHTWIAEQRRKAQGE